MIDIVEAYTQEDVMRELIEAQRGEIERLRRRLGLAEKTTDCFEDEIKRLREAIVMADNRLECADCPACIDVARSYLREALAPDGERRDD